MNKHGLYLIALGFSLTDHGVLHQSFWGKDTSKERKVPKKGVSHYYKCQEFYSGRKRPELWFSQCCHRQCGVHAPVSNPRGIYWVAKIKEIVL